MLCVKIEFFVAQQCEAVGPPVCARGIYSGTMYVNTCASIYICTYKYWFLTTIRIHTQQPTRQHRSLPVSHTFIHFVIVLVC